MSELWGVPDKWATSIDGSDELKMGHEAAQIQHLNALTDQTRIQSQREGLALQMQQKRMQQLASKTGQMAKGADEIETQMMEAANDEIAMGNPDKAARIMSELAQVQNHKAQAKLANEKLNEALYDKDVKKREDMYNIFAGVNSKEDYDKALMMIQGKYPDEKIPPEMQQYNPALVDYMKRVTKTGLEQAKHQEAADKEANVERRHQESLAAARKNLEFRETHQDARARYSQERIDARRKVAGPKPTVINSSEGTMMRAADAMIRKDFPNLPAEVVIGKDQVSSAAYDVASEAKALMAANRGLSSTEAMQRVYSRLKESGAFKSEVEKGFFTDTKKDTYSHPKNVQTGQAKPIPLPPRGTALEDGKIYDKGDGTLFKWDAKRGKGVVIPGGANAE